MHARAISVISHFIVSIPSNSCCRTRRQRERHALAMSVISGECVAPRRQRERHLPVIAVISGKCMQESSRERERKKKK
eukprot:3355281-Rhodomonas_salina.2